MSKLKKGILYCQLALTYNFKILQTRDKTDLLVHPLPEAGGP